MYIHTYIYIYICIYIYMSIDICLTPWMQHTLQHPLQHSLPLLRITFIHTMVLYLPYRMSMYNCKTHCSTRCSTRCNTLTHRSTWYLPNRLRALLFDTILVHRLVGMSGCVCGVCVCVCMNK